MYKCKQNKLRDGGGCTEMGSSAKNGGIKMWGKDYEPACFCKKSVVAKG